MAATVPTTQRAWVCTARGTPDKVLKLQNDYPVPSSSQLPKGTVLIKVKAGALNPVYARALYQALYVYADPDTCPASVETS